MYTPVYTKQFEKDTKRCVQRGKNMEKFKIFVRTLLSHTQMSNYGFGWGSRARNRSPTPSTAS